VKLQRGIRFIKVADISHITAADDYSEVHLTNHPDELLCATPIKAWVERLPRDDFVQIHRSAIVQLTQLESVQRTGDSERWEARLRGGARLPVSRRFARDLRQRFDF
jgi:DNA-binding LytR/AlgR family response regulator